MRRTFIAGGIVGASAVPGCQDHDSGTRSRRKSPMPPAVTCPDVFAPGTRVAEMLTSQGGQSINKADLTGPVDVSWECPNGTIVHQAGNFGWSREGAVWHGPGVQTSHVDYKMRGTYEAHADGEAA